MALPIWAHARGELYTFVAMNDAWTGTPDRRSAHRPREHLVARALLLPADGAGEIVDADHLPERPVPQRQGAARCDAAAVVLPAARRPLQLRRQPLLRRASATPAPATRATRRSTSRSNDVDVVAAATPPYGASLHRAAGWSRPIWRRATTRSPSRWPRSSTPTPPTTTPPSGQSASTCSTTPARAAGNVGQPSVLFRVPFTLRRAAAWRLRQRHRRLRRLERRDRRRDAARRHDQQRPGQRGGAPRCSSTRTERSGARVAHASAPVRPPSTARATPAPVPLPVSFTATATSNGTGATLSGLAVERRTAASRSSATTCATRSLPTSAAIDPIGVLGLDPGRGPAPGRRAGDVDHRSDRAR